MLEKKREGKGKEQSPVSNEFEKERTGVQDTRFGFDSKARMGRPSVEIHVPVKKAHRRMHIA